MGFLARLLRVVPKADRGGIHLEGSERWRVAPTKDVERFVRALPILAPDDSVAYFEDTGEPHVRRYLESLSVPTSVQVAVGTLWPRPDRYHVPLTVKTMEALAAFLEQNPAGYSCSHCHVYCNGVVLLEWHDALADDPMYISRTIGSDAVGAFARALGSSFEIDTWAHR